MRFPDSEPHKALYKWGSIRDFLMRRKNTISTGRRRFRAYLVVLLSVTKELGKKIGRHGKELGKRGGHQFDPENCKDF